MTVPIVPGGSGSRTRPKVDVGQLWSGGVATAIVAGLTALVGVLVCRWLFSVPILAPRSDGAYGDAHTTIEARRFVPILRFRGWPGRREAGCGS
jgi:hypothetical protein